ARSSIAPSRPRSTSEADKLRPIMDQTLSVQPTAQDHRKVMEEYGRAAEAHAYALGNRGPIRFTADGKLDPAILDSYWKHGFYVLQGVVGPEELAELRAAVDDALGCSRLGHGRARLQFHDPALSQHGRQRRLGVAWHPSRAHGRHQENDGRRGLRPHSRRRAAALRCRRYHRHQPPARARLLRQ